MHNLWDNFSATVQRVPERTAVTLGDSRITFLEMMERVEDYRSFYHHYGVISGDRILIWMNNSFEIACALVAVWGNGAIPVLIDSGCRSPQLEHALAKVTPKVVVSEAALPEFHNNESILTFLAEDVPKSDVKENFTTPKILPTDPASIVFTSGSTGKPKGVVQSHANLLRGAQAVYNYLKYIDSDRLLCPVPWSFDYGYGQFLTTLNFGIPHVLPTQQNPFGICEAIEKHRPSILAGTPALFSYLVGGMSPINSTNVSSIRLLTNTGGTLQRNVLNKISEIFPDAELILNYGLTETYRSCYLPSHLSRKLSGCIGIPIPGVDIAIVREDGELAGPREHGEIVHRGDYIFLGYWDDAEATTKAIRPDPLLARGTLSGTRSLYTGDIGYFDDDGFLYYVGRRDHQLKSMGVRVSPGEIEGILHDSLLVEYVAVLGLPDEVLGHEIWAIVVPSKAVDFSLKDLQKYARANMSQYMLPRRYLILDELPRTTTGKVNYSALLETAQDCNFSA